MKKYQQPLLEAVKKAEREVPVERLVNLCEEVKTKAFGKHKQLYSFTEKTIDPDDLKKDLENSLSDVTVETEKDSWVYWCPSRNGKNFSAFR